MQHRYHYRGFAAREIITQVYFQGRHRFSTGETSARLLVARSPSFTITASLLRDLMKQEDLRNT